MSTPIVVVPSGGIAVTEAANGIGVPVTVATNGFGFAVTIVASGGLPVVGSGGAVQNLNTKWTPEGDSLTIGLGGTPAWPFAALSQMPGGIAGTPNTNTPPSSPITGVGTVNVSDIATSGISALTISTTYSTRGGASFDATKNLNLFSIMAGTNTSGVNDTSALQKYRLLRGILRQAKTTGYQRRVIGTITARNDDGGTAWNTILVPLNAFIRAYYNSDLDCDGLIDFGLDPRFGSPTAASNPTYYDTVTVPIDLHPNVVGEAAMGSIAEPTVLAALQGAGTRVAPPMTWSIFDINASITLSNSNRTATSGANGSLVVAGFPTILGKRYWEIVPTSGTPYIGITNDTNITYTGGFDLYSNNNALAYISDGRIMINSVVLVTAATYAAGDVIQFAMDQPNKLIWIRRVRAGVAQSWNGNGSADPVAGIGGLSIAALGNGTSVYIRPALEPSVSGGAATSNFAAAQLSGSIPTGFLALDDSAFPSTITAGTQGRTLSNNALTQLVPGTAYYNQNFTAAGGLSIAAGSGNIILDHCSHTANAAAVANIDTNGFTGILTLQNCEIIGAGLSSSQTGNMGVWNRSACTLNIFASYFHEIGQTINLNGATGANLIQDTLIQHQLGGAATHYEAIYYGGGGGAGFSLDVEHCHIINENVQTACIFIENQFGTVSNITINNNLLEMNGGGDWPIAVDGHNTPGNTISGVTITNNQLHMLAGSQFFNLRGPDGTLGTITSLTMTNNMSSSSGFQIWSPNVTYALNALIEGWDGWEYKSLQAANLNNAQPNSGGSTAWWSSSGLPGFIG